ncbi:MAG: XRE family transcriptional regulator [Anaerolineae bacterium]|nr:XRE family transcriptional regulator [Anaerolineae bacterium]
MDISHIPLTVSTSLGELLRFLRRRARLSQRELSIAVGYSESHISRIENNERPVDRASLLALFVPAVEIENEPETIARLLALCEQAQPLPASSSPAPVPSRPGAEPQPVPPNRLPVQLTSFIGRAEELAELRELLADDQTRLLTLTGAGGCGKTRLALRVGEGMAHAYSHGVWLVELAADRPPACWSEKSPRPSICRKTPTARCWQPWPISCAPARLCSSWTTANTWWMRPRTWPPLSCRSVPICAFWPPAARTWPSPAKSSIRFNPSPCRRPCWAGAPAGLTWKATTPSASSWSGPGRCCAALPSATRTRRPSPASASGWTASPWASNWPRPGCPCFHRRKSRPGWNAISTCPREDGEPSCPATKPWPRPSHGAIICSLARSRRCCAVFPSLAATGRWKPQKKSPGICRPWPRRMCWGCCDD